MAAVASRVGTGARAGRPLVRFVVRRLASLVPLLAFVVVTTFAVMHLAPGNPWDAISQANLDQGGAPLSAQTVHQLRVEYGLDRPWWSQLAAYLWHLLHLDLGTSYTYRGTSVASLVGQRLPTTLTLAGLAFAAAVTLGIVAGTVAGLRPSSWVDYAVTGVSSVLTAVPNFVVGIFLVVVLSVYLRQATGGQLFLPDSGFGLGSQLVLPLVVLTLHPAALLARVARSAVVDMLGSEHVRTARAKGLAPRRVTVSHVLKNAMIPIVTVAVPMFGYLIAGTVVVETLFQIPGVGSLLVNAAADRDYPVLLGVTTLYAVVFAVANLVADVLAAVLDPRVDLE